jgi:PHD/YefM family antitoxin component YafN of YafNO toxin-antitoxin module
MENKKLNEVVVELIDEYIERHKETLELLAIPGFYEKLMESSREFRKGRGMSLENARKEVEG